MLRLQGSRKGQCLTQQRWDMMGARFTFAQFWELFRFEYVYA